MNPKVVFDTSLLWCLVVSSGDDADHRAGRKSMERDAPFDHAMCRKRRRANRIVRAKRLKMWLLMDPRVKRVVHGHHKRVVCARLRGVDTSCPKRRGKPKRGRGGCSKRLGKCRGSCCKGLRGRGSCRKGTTAECGRSKLRKGVWASRVSSLNASLDALSTQRRPTAHRHSAVLNVRLHDAYPFAVVHHSDTRKNLRPEVIVKQVGVYEGNKIRVL